MTSEIRVNKLTNRIGLSTVTFADSGIGVTVTGRIDPDTDSARDLGTDTVRWRNGYFDTLYGDGSNLTGISAGVSLANGVDDRLVTATGAAALNGEANLTFDGTLLTVSGKITCDLNSDIDMSNGADGQLQIGGNGYTSAIALNDEGMQIYHNSGSRAIIFGTNETEKVRITSDGYVGINTNNPVNALEVLGKSGNTDTIAGVTVHEIARFNADTSEKLGLKLALDNTNKVFYLHRSDNGGDFAFSMRSGGQSLERLRITHDGKVGINETAPSAMLHVENDNTNSSTYYLNGDAAILVQNKNSNATAKTVIKLEGPAGSGDCALVYGAGSTNMIFSDRENERLRIGSSGQIGIAGANYGDAGQVLTSQGSSSAPTWASVSSPLSNRNLIINGAMLVDQRGDYSTNSSNASRQYGGPDRFHQYYYQSDESARYTFKQGGSGVSPVDKGFSRTAILDVTTQQTSVTAGQAIWTSQRIEANNASHLKYGHSDAESVTLSFWIKSSVIGNYSITYGHTNMDERYITTYTVNVADTWEKKIITIPGDTRSGKTIAATNGYGLEVKWVWMSGSSRVATPNQWATQGNKYGASGVTLANIFSSASNNLYLTGVQLEIGTTATPFEHIPFADELARCQRYFVKFAGGSDAYCFPAKGQGSSSCDIGIPLPTALRAQPSITLSNHRYFSSHSGGFSSSTNTPSVIHYNSPSGTTGSPMISLNAGGHSSSNNATGTFTPQGSSFSIDAEL